MPAIYLDHLSAARPHPEVITAMIPYLGDPYFGNPSSRHQFGEPTRTAVDDARQQVSELVGCQPEEILFTASGSESNNLAIKGILAGRPKPGHIITTAVEQMSVLHPIRTLEEKGHPVTRLGVDRHGRVDPDDLRHSLRPDTALVTIGHGIGEVGTVQPIADLAAIAEDAGVPFHTDAVATSGIVPVDLSRVPIAAASMSPHRFHGPAGAGILFLRQGIILKPEIEGGVQESGLRAGTENVAAIVGSGVAACLARRQAPVWRTRLDSLARQFRMGLQDRLSGWIPTGHPEDRIPGHLSLCIQGVEGEAVLEGLDRAGIAAATGSACASEALKDSYVLEALGLAAPLRRSSLVFSFGIFNQDQEVDAVLEILPGIVSRLRAISPFGDSFAESVSG